ncbi:dihydrofolate reductase [Alkalihalobacillus alcalophilus ATCC 27647 = CGMCC 1.3604]|uniref:Dihydrofolate reductase n=1 Tax=Alkalihalobacillus alcalophilus ATCC 27647 = CGMCC 1.3604 TaxID=1218173 RepID=A0A094WF70_ALKAL|nr:dihydrofolate reductase [Alkalihalobacillus alcalophilus]KGA96404.1 dihydrofolate reductase [Alkalihalobacillus alcalophilus ATCC 27647 = CGMCC 1.3604]MED1560465.1 dihydrofolate reductase [Alkalihalobacillus alcalophilus]THG90856.1 dihydrofolate reductase [Alkalihalobacillus alcalophilus ATCC 27647 = CGMCC 1.3604]
MISYIFAMAEDGVIGKDNDMPWHLPNDLKYFKKVTSGSTVVMGRKTYESLGRALPKRRNIVLTTDEAYQAPGCEVVHSKEEVLKAIAGENEAFVIGGAGLYDLFRGEVEKIYVTKINESFVGDTFFPKWDWTNWELIAQQEGTTDQENKYQHTFLTYQKRG